MKFETNIWDEISVTLNCEGHEVLAKGLIKGLSRRDGSLESLEVFCNRLQWQKPFTEPVHQVATQTKPEHDQAFADVFKVYRPRPNSVPVGTWRLKLWERLSPLLREYRQTLEVDITEMVSATAWPYYVRLEVGTASFDEFAAHFWVAWEYLDKKAYPDNG